MKRRIYTWIATWHEIGWECVWTNDPPPWRARLARVIVFHSPHRFDFYKYAP